MPDPITLTAVVELATRLPPTEQKQLAESILQRLASTAASGPRRRAWREIRGSVAHPLCGEDAQVWVSHSRQEAEDQVRAVNQASATPSLDDVYALLERRFDSGEYDVAARHDEHQP